MSDSEGERNVPNNGRVLRSRRYKRPFEDNRSHKRLFTPEIKRHLKAWLIRRRENPYPSREEKKELSIQTGLTYIQICNWFANWRRKLKNSGRNVNQYTWSSLIKGYNDHIMGNLEHLSISSDDSIWEETEYDRYLTVEKQLNAAEPMDHSYTSSAITNEPDESGKRVQDEAKGEGNPASERDEVSEPLPQCFQISSTTDFIENSTVGGSRTFERPLKSNRRYVEKRRKNLRCEDWNYERLTHPRTITSISERDPVIRFAKYHGREADSVLLSKWKRSIACFQPNCNNYLIHNGDHNRTNATGKKTESCHDREELDAAEALTFLSRTTRGRHT